MKIASVEVIPVCSPMAVGRGPSVLTYQRRETLFIKLVTDDGIVGWGETYRLAGVEAALREVLAPMLIGCDPLLAGRLHQDMLLATFHNGFAVGGIDIALHDLRGKALGVPVHALYGGALRPSVEAYASLPGYFEDQDPEQHWLDEAHTLIAQGFHGLKFRIGRFSVEREARVLGQVRQAVGRDVRLMADANAAYSSARTLNIAPRLRDLDFEWLEEPLPQNGYLGYPDLRARMDLPLAGGESLTTRAAANEALQRGCFDIVQPDVSICGGIVETLFIGELARLSAVRCIPHCWAGAVTLAATLHVAALLPDPSRLAGVDPPLLEFDVTENPFRTEVVVGQPFELRDGRVAVPTAPGLGIEIDEAALRRYGAQSG